LVGSVLSPYCSNSNVMILKHEELTYETDDDLKEEKLEVTVNIKV